MRLLSFPLCLSLIVVMTGAMMNSIPFPSGQPNTNLGRLSLTSATDPLIVGNNAADGDGPIQTYDLTTGSLVNSFIPDGATSAGANGRAVAVVGNEVFYSELSEEFGASDAIHVAPFNDGAGGSDIRTIPNPAPSTGIQDLEYSNGALYALTGYDNGALQVWSLAPDTGAVITGPIAIDSAPDADGFTILPDGDFLINTGDASCTYDEYDPTTGDATGTSITVPGGTDCTGVDTNGTALFFQTNWDSFTETDLAGNLIATTSVQSNLIEDVSLVGNGGGLIAAFGDSVAAGEGNTINSPTGPTGLAAEISGSSGSLPGGAYQYEVTGVTTSGESLPSSPASIIPLGSNIAIALTWNPLAGASSYNVYRTLNGSSASIGLLASGLTMAQYTDTGASTPATAQPPPPYNGYPNDSSDAYPAVLASDLGMSVDNFAISGACADMSPQLANCGSLSSPKQTVAGELLTAQSMNLQPSLVTLTVGGNDINFESCIKSLLGVSTSTPCSDTKADLAAIKSNVTSQLVEIKGLYPGVPVILTLYYDPLPPTLTSITNSNSPCSQESVLYAIHQFVQQGDWLGAAKTLVTGNVGSGGKKFFNNLFSQASSIENKLNSTLTNAASTAKKLGVDVQTVQLDFSGHDFCQDYSGGNGGWIFGPQIFASGEVTHLGSATVSYTPTDICVVPDAGCNIESKSGSGHGYSYSYKVSINDLPHPTAAGQQAIANQLEPTAASVLGSG
jgi:lysophospholipase L1-like esterase